MNNKELTALLNGAFVKGWVVGFIAGTAVTVLVVSFIVTL